jgi:DNA-binding transcriptional regulator YdaS (Cro superfamily)
VDLRKYLDELPRGGRAEVSARLGISAVYLSQLAARQNNREPSPELCVCIERATSGAVVRWDLRPDDWHLIWPELIGQPGAPDVAATAEAQRAA